VREDGKIVGGEGWQEIVQIREEWKKHLRTARILLHSAHANGMNESIKHNLLYGSDNLRCHLHFSYRVALYFRWLSEETMTF